MERTDIFRVYELGAAVRPLLRLADRTTTNQIFAPLWGAQAALGELLSNEPQIRIEFCKKHADDLLSIINSIDNQYFKNDKGEFHFPDSNTEIAPWTTTSLRSAAQNFETVFQVEVQNAAIFRVPKIGAYDIADLVNSADIAFPTGLSELISPRTLNEYRQAGRCYAFGLNTASGYHACRAIEAAFRDYYKFFIGKDASENASWGPMIDRLERSQETKKASERTLQQIRHVKDFSRNPLSHLRAELEEVHADMLFSGAKVVIIAMTQEIKEAGEAVEPSFKLVGGSSEGQR